MALESSTTSDVLPRLPLARTAVDPDGIARSDPALLETLAASPRTRVLLLHRGRLAVSGGALDLVTTAAVPPEAWRPQRLLYLGRDADASYVALVLPEDVGALRDLDGRPTDAEAPLLDLAEAHEFGQLRHVGPDLGDRDAGLATTAVALSAWHERNVRCTRCGGPTDVRHAGWERYCPHDDLPHYPRTDPAIIVAVTDDADRLLLGHASHWPAGRYSCLAGYVEPGESLEEAVRREVSEESQVDVVDVGYRGSQPWPFPCSLMVAFAARVRDGSRGDPVADGQEIEDVRFFTRSELAAEVAAGDVLLPARVSIARALIEQWYGSPIEDR